MFIDETQWAVMQCAALRNIVNKILKHKCSFTDGQSRRGFLFLKTIEGTKNYSNTLQSESWSINRLARMNIKTKDIWVGIFIAFFETAAFYFITLKNKYLFSPNIISDLRKKKFWYDLKCELLLLVNILSGRVVASIIKHFQEILKEIIVLLKAYLKFI